MKKVLFSSIAIVIGVAAGVLATRPLILNWFENSVVENGSWRTHPDIGSENSGMYLRAVIAAGGLFALDRKESMYWSLDQVNGKPLSNRCHYEIVGTQLDARWWSLTAYDRASFLIPNAINRYSYNNRNVQLADGQWRIQLSPEKQEGQWLPSRRPDNVPVGKNDVHTPPVLPGPPDQIRLILRLYHPGEGFNKAPTKQLIPTVTEVSCS